MFRAITGNEESSQSKIPIRGPKVSMAHYTHHQEVVLLQGLPVEGAILHSDFIDSPTDLIPLHNPPLNSCLDYFSQPTLRQDLSKALEALDKFSPEDVKTGKKEADPYSKAAEFQNKTRQFVKMTNLAHLYPELISEDKNFLFPSYNFVTICDKGGFSQCISKHYSDINVGMKEIRGWALFPRGEIRLKGVKCEAKPEINFKSIEEVIESVRADSESEVSFGPSIMLLTASFSLKEPNMYVKERLWKLYLGYAVYAGMKLLGKGGNLVVKIGSTVLPGTVEMMYLLYRHFQSISVVKPFSTSSYSSTKYLVCQDFDGSVSELENVRRMCMVMERLHKQGRDLEHLLDLTEVTKHQDFLNYILDTNRKCMSVQIVRLKELEDYLQTEDKVQPNRQDIAKRCWVEWGLEERKTEVEERPSDVRLYSQSTDYPTSQSSTYSQPRRLADLSRYSSIIDRNPINIKLTPMTRTVQPTPSMDEMLANFTDIRKDNREKVQKMLKNTGKSKKTGSGKKTQSEESEPNPRKIPKLAAKSSKK